MKIVHSERTAIGRQRKEVASSLKTKKAASSSPDLAGAILFPRLSSDERDVYALCSVDHIDRLLKDPESCVLGDSVEEIEAQIAAKHPCSRADATFIIPCADISVTYRHEMTDEEQQAYKKLHGVARAGGIDTRSQKVTKGWIVTDRAYMAKPQDANHLKVATIELGPVLVDDERFKEIFGDPTDRYGNYDIDAVGVRCANEAGFSVAYRQIYGDDYVQVNYNPNVSRQREYRRKRKEVSDRFETEFSPKMTYSAYAILHPGHWPGRSIGHAHLRGREMYESRGWGNKRRNSFDEREVMDLLALGRRMNPTDRYWYRSARAYDSYFDCIKDLCEAAFPRIHSVEKRIRKQRAKMEEEIREEYREHQERCQRYLDHTREFHALIRLEGEGGIVVEDELVMKGEYQYDYEEKRNRYVERLRPEWRWPEHLEKYYDRISERDHEPPVRYDHTEDEHVAKEFPTRWGESMAAQEEAFCRWLRREGKEAGVKLPKPPVMPKPPKKVVRKKKVKRGRKGRRRKQLRHLCGVGADFVRQITRQARKAG